MRFAHVQGFHRIAGIVLPENQPMIALAPSSRFRTTYDQADHLLRVSFSLKLLQMPEQRVSSNPDIHVRTFGSVLRESPCPRRG